MSENPDGRRGVKSLSNQNTGTPDKKEKVEANICVYALLKEGGCRRKGKCTFNHEFDITLKNDAAAVQQIVHTVSDVQESVPMTW